MNSDEFGSLIRKLLIAMITAFATKLHIDDATGAALAADVADLAVIAWGVYAHRGMKKVPETARVVPDPNRSLTT